MPTKFDRTSGWKNLPPPPVGASPIPVPLPQASVVLPTPAALPPTPTSSWVPLITEAAKKNPITATLIGVTVLLGAGLLWWRSSGDNKESGLIEVPAEMPPSPRASNITPTPATTSPRLFPSPSTVAVPKVTLPANISMGLEPAKDRVSHFLTFMKNANADSKRLAVIERKLGEIFTEKIVLLSEAQDAHVVGSVTANRLDGYQQFFKAISTEPFYSLDNAEQRLFEFYMNVKRLNYTNAILHDSQRFYTQKNLNNYVGLLQHYHGDVFNHLYEAAKQLQVGQFSKQSCSEVATHKLFSVFYVPPSPDLPRGAFYIMTPFCLEPMHGNTLVKVAFKMVVAGNGFNIYFPQPLVCEIRYLAPNEPAAQTYAREFRYALPLKHYVIKNIALGRTLPAAANLYITTTGYS